MATPPPATETQPAVPPDAQRSEPWLLSDRADILIVARALPECVDSSCTILRRLARGPSARSALMFWLEPLDNLHVRRFWTTARVEEWRGRQLADIEAQARSQLLTGGLPASVQAIACPAAGLAAAAQAVGPHLIVLARPSHTLLMAGDEWWQIYATLRDGDRPVLVI